jgi:glycosyltransferase involved in cell wall biosynthesis
MNNLDIAIANMFEKKQGVTNVAMGYKNALENTGHRVSFIQFSVGKEKNLISARQKGISLLSRKLLKAFNILFTFPRSLSKVNADLLILSDPWLLKAAKYRNDCVLIFHDSRQLTRYRDGIVSTILFRQLLKYLDRVKAIIAVSKVTKEDLVLIGVERSKIFVIENSYEQSGLLQYKKQMRLDRLQKRTLNVYYVAAYQRHKNVVFFLNLAKKVLSDGNFIDINFYLISNINTNKIGIYKSIIGRGLTILNWVDDMDNFLVDMDLLIFPSDYEGFGLPMIEAISLGIPVIARDLPITKEVLGNSGIFMKELILEEWIQEILRFRNEEYYNKISQLSEERSMFFNFRQFTEKVNKTINEIHNSEMK